VTTGGIKDLEDAEMASQVIYAPIKGGAKRTLGVSFSLPSHKNGGS
jgi:hypothetical protein